MESCPAPLGRFIFWIIQKTPLNYSKISKYSEPLSFPGTALYQIHLFSRLIGIAFQEIAFHCIWPRYQLLFWEKSAFFC